MSGGGGVGEKPWGRWRNVTTAAGASVGVDVDLFPMRQRERHGVRKIKNPNRWILAAAHQTMRKTS